MASITMIFAQVADPPVINVVRPTVVFQEPGRRLYATQRIRTRGPGGDGR